MLREHRRQEVADQRWAFVEYLAAQQKMAHSASNRDIPGFIAAREELDRARARVNLFGPSSEIVTALTNLAITWGAISTAARDEASPNTLTDGEALGEAFRVRAPQVAYLEDEATRAFRVGLANLDPENRAEGANEALSVPQSES
jgi:hypothetical protein